MRAFASLTVVTIATLVSINASAEESILSLTASGLIIRPPHWEDAASNTINTINFDFSGSADISRPNHDVDSLSVRAKLVDAQQDNTRVALVRPRECKIGKTQVRDDHVHFMHNGHAHTSDGKEVQIRSGVLQTFALRFSKDGQYRDKSGAVGCDHPGSLTYSY